ncbi:MAG: hypothetical protein KKC39_08355 [Candidatus Omnitrophica bacterium]|nr:hypothetical protein [Candidatus Omnitrophota bacterium]MBU4302854.1 hypothetical protein [Candidatus Omnitrophota bacterium]MBU4418340.1 hypothetical protein [Candidatus Omnitrophota bacterium]MBU4468729.1 hypothetical protein [Candidatus Omnitrophota bacterium]MCG2707747.1 hypothetical protein [Candidatus Omnitrophota bacterium]
MNLKKAVVLSGFAIGMMVTAQIVLAEEAAVAPTDSVVITSNQQAASPKENDMQWAWGEVTNLDNQAKTITLKHLDYETDQEKELVLVVDEKTVLENIKDFNELKLKDTLSIDYMLGADNKNIAKNISFEKPDAASSAPAPDLAQPTTPSETPVDSSIAANTAPASIESAPVPVASEPVSAVQEQAQ